MKMPIPPFGGSGGGDSSECTATAADVLEGKTAVYNGSNDEPAEGSMKDYSGTTQSATASLDSSNNRVQMTVPNTGKYDTAARLYSAFSNLASLLGITADIIKKGETVLGITGTWEGYVAEVGDLYYNGSLGTIGGSLSVYYEDTGYAVADKSCIRLEANASSDPYVHAYASFGFSTAINCADYNTLTMELEITQNEGASYAYMNRYVGIGLFTSRPTSASACHLEEAYTCAYLSRLDVGHYTLTVDLSSIQSNLYVAGCACNNSTSYGFTVEVTRVSVS